DVNFTCVLRRLQSRTGTFCLGNLSPKRAPARLSCRSRTGATIPVRPMSKSTQSIAQWLDEPHHPWIQRLISLVWVPEARDPEVIAEQRQVLLNRTIVISFIGLIVIPFTILSYLAEMRPEKMSTGIAISVAAEAS